MTCELQLAYISPVAKVAKKNHLSMIQPCLGFTKWQFNNYRVFDFFLMTRRWRINVSLTWISMIEMLTSPGGRVNTCIWSWYLQYEKWEHIPPRLDEWYRFMIKSFNDVHSRQWSMMVKETRIHGERKRQKIRYIT